MIDRPREQYRQTEREQILIRFYFKQSRTVQRSIRRLKELEEGKFHIIKKNPLPNSVERMEKGSGRMQTHY